MSTSSTQKLTSSFFCKPFIFLFNDLFILVQRPICTSCHSVSFHIGTCCSTSSNCLSDIIITMKQAEITRLELDWLCLRILQLYSDRDTFTPNSHLKNYKELSAAMMRVVRDSKQEYVSTNLLRKLFYYSKDHPSVIFRIGFVDACYRFISEGTFNREEFLEHLLVNPTLDPTSSHPLLMGESVKGNVSFAQQLKYGSYRLVGYGILFFTIVTLMLILVRLIDFRTIPWALSKPPHHTLWVIEYEDGTKLYNRFRKYRSYDEVRWVYSSAHRSKVNKIGDCNSYMLDSLGNHIPVCLVSMDQLRIFEKEHGAMINLYQDSLSVNLHQTE